MTSPAPGTSDLPPGTEPVLLMGPTAAGKSAVALALARRFPVEIISVDSAQVYRGLDVGTAKPTPGERAEVPHHLIDIVDPSAAYSAARFAADAGALVRAIRRRGRLPLLVGGTMLYFRALRDGLTGLPEADAGVRAAIEAEAALRGWPALHAELADVDPETALRLDRNDAQRIQRALEIHRLSGVALSTLLRNAPRSPGLGAHRAIALFPEDRQDLHRRIARRFDAMLDGGLVAEVAELRRRYRLGPEMPSMRSVGYRQAWEHLDGLYDVQGLRERGIAATRQLAKRQITWLRQTEARRFDPGQPEVADEIGAWLEAATKG